MPKKVSRVGLLFRLRPGGPWFPEGTPVGLATRELMLVGIAALRLAWWFRRRSLAALLSILRQGKPLGPRLRDPELHRWVVERFLHRLPPRRMGPCLKRSLLLLHLFSRCGLEPQFHLGVAVDPQGRWQGHAWVTAQGLVYGAPTGQADCFIEFDNLGQLGAF